VGGIEILKIQKKKLGGEEEVPNPAQPTVLEANPTFWERHGEKNEKPPIGSPEKGGLAGKPQRRGGRLRGNGIKRIEPARLPNADGREEELRRL